MLQQIYVANPTQQHRDLFYRVGTPGNWEPRVRTIKIAPGRQVMLPDKLEGEKLDIVLQQIALSGGVLEGDAKSIKHRFSLLYKVGPVVSTEEKAAEVAIKPASIENAAEVEMKARQDLSSDQMEKAGMSIFEEAAKVGGRETSVEIVQVDDNSEVRNGVQNEIVVSANQGVAKKATTARPRGKNAKK